MSIFKLVRIVALMSILFVLLVGSWMTERRLANWERPVRVTFYPIAAEDDAEARVFLKSVDEASFADINTFFERESIPYGIELTPGFRIQIAPVSHELPPPLPDLYSPLHIAWWSLKMRWWSWRMKRRDGLIEPDIQMFVVYHGVNNGNEVEISVGMRKGLYGLVNAYASDGMNSRNQVVIAHELMHVLGATDKYVMATGEPEFPFGYADPNQRPLFPQKRAEIMGGRRPLSSFVSEMPSSLEDCKIGRKTAEEIGFFEQLID
jgi:hypothetical protein